MVDEQAIGFVSHRGRRVAYAVTGAGPVLLFDVGRAHHLKVFWRHLPYRNVAQALSRCFKLGVRSRTRIAAWAVRNRPAPNGASA